LRWIDNANFVVLKINDQLDCPAWQNVLVARHLPTLNVPKVVDIFAQRRPRRVSKIQYRLFIISATCIRPLGRTPPPLLYLKRLAIHVAEKSPSRSSGHSLRFDADAIVHGSADPLLTAEITFGCLYGYMSQQELNLVQFSACGIAQLRA
jgi:hypothetical protein